jgi:hypothetical protein
VLLAALIVITVGMALNGLNIVYMTGSGTQLAEQVQAGDTAAARLHKATHPTALVAARFGNFRAALGAAALGWAEWRDGSAGRLFAGLAWLVAAAGLVGVLFFHESTRFILAAVAALSAWQLATAVRALKVGEKREN